jgi:hypothetical protein
MKRTVSWSEAFFFWRSLFWESFFLFNLIGIVVAIILPFAFPNSHPAGVAIIGYIFITCIFPFAMVIPIKNALQKYKDKLLYAKYQQRRI